MKQEGAGGPEGLVWTPPPREMKLRSVWLATGRGD